MSREEREERAESSRELGREYCRSLPAEYRPGWELFGDYLRERGLDPELAKLNHWYPSRAAGDIELRIVVPGTSRLPGNLFWQARAIGSHVLTRYQSPHAARGDAIIVVWPRGHVIGATAVVEGPMDALAAAGEGVTGIALMGVTPPDFALDLTATFVRGTIALVVADSDSLGAMAKVGFKLLSRGCGTKLVNPAPHKDLASAPRHERRRILELT